MVGADPARDEITFMRMIIHKFSDELDTALVSAKGHLIQVIQHEQTLILFHQFLDLIGIKGFGGIAVIGCSHQGQELLTSPQFGQRNQDGNEKIRILFKLSFGRPEIRQALLGNVP